MKVIQDFPNYKIDIDGQVWSCRKQGISHPTSKWKLLKPFKNPKGYLQVRLYQNSNYKRVLKVHRLVAKAYIPNPHKLSQVNHKDGNKENNSYLNLEWTTNEENMNHANEIGLRKHIYKNQYKPVSQLTKGGYPIVSFYSIKDAAILTSNRSAHITAVCKNKRKTAGGFKWQYA